MRRFGRLLVPQTCPWELLARCIKEKEISPARMFSLPLHRSPLAACQNEQFTPALFGPLSPGSLSEWTVYPCIIFGAHSPDSFCHNGQFTPALFTPALYLERTLLKASVIMDSLPLHYLDHSPLAACHNRQFIPALYLERTLLTASVRMDSLPLHYLPLHYIWSALS